MSLEKIWSAVRQSLQTHAPSGEVPELSEIRHDILEEIRGNIQELSAGRYVFPFNRILVDIRPRTPAERAAIQTVWIDGGELQAEIRSVLSRADCQYDRNLIVETHLREAFAAADPEIDAGRNFWLSFESVGRQAAATSPLAGPALAEPGAPRSLSVLTGTAEPSSLVLSAAITNLGRLREVFDSDGQFVRSNDVAFSEVENGINETVGRTHAHIVRRDDGRFALVNSRRHDKTPVAIIRNGRSIPIILIPEPIQPGDVILLGRARIGVN
ncbi:MAG TPA: hypothetical protein VGM43_20740 [Bryobacteraceae bacterium]|jgi:hypothetical protein